MGWIQKRILQNRGIQGRTFKSRRIERRRIQRRRIPSASHRRTWAALIAGAVFFAAAAQGSFADSREETGLLPSFRPFTLNLYDARMAEALLTRVGLVQVESEGESSRIVKVKSVRIVYAGENAGLPEPHRYRYNIELNGSPLDWNNTFIKYDSKMMNLRALFTYRNQRPVPEGPY